jgi:hypothetical protein
MLSEPISHTRLFLIFDRVYAPFHTSSEASP